MSLKLILAMPRYPQKLFWEPGSLKCLVFGRFGGPTFQQKPTISIKLDMDVHHPSVAPRQPMYVHLKMQCLSFECIFARLLSLGSSVCKVDGYICRFGVSWFMFILKIVDICSSEVLLLRTCKIHCKIRRVLKVGKHKMITL